MEIKQHKEIDFETGNTIQEAIGICNHCRSEVILECGWANQCEGCGVEYNGSGQELVSREFWGEETGELGQW